MKVHADTGHASSYNGSQYETGERMNSHRPSIGAVSELIPYSRGRVWKDLLWVGIFPPIVWSIVMAIVPLKEAVPGLSWKNAACIGYFGILIGAATMMFHFHGLWFYRVTVKMSVIAWVGSFGVPCVLFIIVMAFDAFPVPVFNCMIILSAWWPLTVWVYYSQLSKSGSLDKTDKEAVLEFLKWQLVMLICGGFAALSIGYILAFFRAKTATHKMSVLIMYGFAGYLLRKVSMPLMEKLIPQRLVAANDDASEFHVAMVRHSLYYFLDVCQEIFTTLSLFEVADVASAMFVVVQELTPLALSLLKFHPEYYDFMKKRFPQTYLGTTLSSHRLLVCEKLALKILAELVACVGVVIIAFAMRYGPNEEFFPLRSHCEKDFLFSASVNLFLFVCVAFMAVIFDFVCRHCYGLHLLRLVGRHLRFNFRMLFVYTLSLYVFPAGMLLKQLHLLLSVNEEAYNPPPALCE